MPNPSLKKTKSAPEPLKIGFFARYKRVLIGAGLIIAALVALFSPSIFYRPATAELRVGGQTRTLEIAASETARDRGLGYRDSMPANKGMLFVFNQPSSDCFWMKGMRFPLDMIWLDGQKKVTKVAADVPVDGYPSTEYCPDQPAKYVIELNAGQARQLGLTSGRQVSF